MVRRCVRRLRQARNDASDGVVQWPQLPGFLTWCDINVPQDSVSEQSERFFVAEIVREKIFLQYHQEIPYSTAVRG